MAVNLTPSFDTTVDAVKIPITKSQPYTIVTLHTVAIDDILTGEMFVIHADGQVNTTYAYNCMIGCKLSFTDANGMELEQIARAYAENFTAAVHHKPWTRVGGFVAASPRPGRSYLKHQAWAAASRVTPRSNLTVVAGHKLFVWRFTPE